MMSFHIPKETLKKLPGGHNHDWIIRYSNVRYRDIDGGEYVIDAYQCECGAGGDVKTPLAIYKQGNKKLGIDPFVEGKNEF